MVFDLKIDHREVQNEAEVPAPAWTFSCVPLPVVFVFVLHAAFPKYHQLELLLAEGYFHFPNPKIKIYAVIIIFQEVKNKGMPLSWQSTFL